MNTEPPVEPAITKPLGRFARSRVLLGFVTVCVLVWGIKAIHYAMQPKYDGKTASEWFEEAKGFDFSTENRQGRYQQPAVIALKGLGTNAVWYLWKETNRTNSTLTTLGWKVYDRIAKKESLISRDKVRQRKAYELLILMDNIPEAFILELAKDVRGTDASKARQAIWLLYQF